VALVLFSENYQVTGPIQRMARILASQGYIVAALEVLWESLYRMRQAKETVDWP